MLNPKNPNPQFLFGNQEPIRDHDLEVLPGLKPEDTKPVTPKKPIQGLAWYEYLFYILLLIAIWIVGQITVGIPDELGGEIIVFAFALIRQHLVQKRNQ